MVLFGTFGERETLSCNILHKTFKCFNNETYYKHVWVLDLTFFFFKNIFNKCKNSVHLNIIRNIHVEILILTAPPFMPFLVYHSSNTFWAGYT